MTVKSPRIFGRLSIIFGAIISFKNLNELVTDFAVQTNLNLPQKLVDVAVNLAHVYKPVNIVMLVFSLVLLVIGFGQLNYRRWVQQWTVMWSYSALLTLVIKSSYLFMYARVYQAMQLNYLTDQFIGIKNAYTPLMTGILLIAGELVTFAPYPILLLIFFNKQKVKESLKN